MHQLDCHLFRCINGGLACSLLDPIMLLLSIVGAGVGHAALSIGIIWLGWLRHSVVIRRAGYAAAIACAAAGLASPIFKMLFSRPRPLLAIYDVRVVGDPLFTNSFPSGHTATAFAVAIAATVFLPRLRWAWLAYAAMIGLSRVYVGAHFPFDVVGGALIGLCVGWLSAWILRSGSSPTAEPDGGEPSGKVAIRGEARSGRVSVALLALALLCISLFFFRLGAIPLLGLDEAMYAEAAREMAAGGSWIVPHYNGEPFFDKPPLGYWLMAASIEAFGANSLAARLPAALAGLALVGLTAAIGNRLYGRTAGLLAGFALASCIMSVALARMAILDMLFALTITAALGLFLLAYLELVPRSAYWGFWAATGLSVMVKGPAGAVLILATVSAFGLIRRRPGWVRHMMPVPGLLILLAVTLPWYLAVQHETGGAFLREFVFHQNLDRAMGKDFHHNLPFYFYLPIYLVGFFPWSVLVPVAWRRAIRSDGTRSVAAGVSDTESSENPSTARRGSEAALFLAVWIAVIGIIFSVLRSKLPAYIYPIFPPSALLIGGLFACAIAKPKEVSLVRPVTIAFVLSAVLGVALLFGPRLLPRPIPGLNAVLPLMGIAMVLGGVGAFVYARLRRYRAAFAALAAGMAAFTMIATSIGLPIVSRANGDPAVTLAGIVRDHAEPGVAVVGYQVSTSIPSLPFYAGRPITFDKDAALIRRMVRSGGKYILIAREDRREGLPKGWRPFKKVDRYLIFRLPRK